MMSFWGWGLDDHLRLKPIQSPQVHEDSSYESDPCGSSSSYANMIWKNQNYTIPYMFLEMMIKMSIILDMPSFHLILVYSSATEEDAGEMHFPVSQVWCAHVGRSPCIYICVLRIGTNLIFYQFTKVESMGVDQFWTRRVKPASIYITNALCQANTI